MVDQKIDAAIATALFGPNSEFDDLHIEIYRSKKLIERDGKSQSEKKKMKMKSETVQWYFLCASASKCHQKKWNDERYKNEIGVAAIFIRQTEMKLNNNSNSTSSRNNKRQPTKKNEIFI